MDVEASHLEINPVSRSDSVQAVLRWHEQGQKRLSIGLELEPSMASTKHFR